jgi:hypothetical protein
MEKVQETLQVVLTRLDNSSKELERKMEQWQDKVVQRVSALIKDDGDQRQAHLATLVTSAIRDELAAGLCKESGPATVALPVIDTTSAALEKAAAEVGLVPVALHVVVCAHMFGNADVPGGDSTPFVAWSTPWSRRPNFCLRTRKRRMRLRSGWE